MKFKLHHKKLNHTVTWSTGRQYAEATGFQYICASYHYNNRLWGGNEANYVLELRSADGRTYNTAHIEQFLEREREYTHDNRRKQTRHSERDLQSVQQRGMGQTSTA